MDAPIVVIFQDIEHALNALKAGQPTASGAVVVTRDPNGSLLLKETMRERSGATFAGAFILGLAGLPLGVGGAMLGAVAGGLIGAAADFLDGDGEARLVNEIGLGLKPGKPRWSSI